MDIMQNTISIGTILLVAGTFVACGGGGGGGTSAVGCKADADCEPGQQCIQEQCQLPAPSCIANVDCGPGKECAGGVCIDSTLPPTSDTTTPPSGDTTTPPSGDTTTPPSGDTTTPPSGDTTLPPSGDGNESFEQAVALEFDSQSPLLESLKTTGDEDFFSFEGTKGQVVMVMLQAQNPAFDPDSIDTVLTLYDSNKVQIAQNDDPFPRDTNDSTLLTMLPADGTYYLLVEECWTWIGKKGLTAGCAEPMDKVVTDYALFLLNIDSAQDANVLDEETGNTSADATTIQYSKNAQSGNYFLTLVYGLFADNMDTDVFSFQLPADLPVQAPARTVAYFSIHPSGVDGNGSTSSVGNAYITTAADTATKVAWINGADGGSLDVPLPNTEEYLLFLEHPGGLAGANDFYVINHRGSGSNPVEADEAGNNTTAGAEALTAQNNTDGTTSYFIEGNLPENDTDIFMFDVPASINDTISVACGGQRSGSGVRGLKAEVLSESENAVVGGSSTESATQDLYVQAASVPSGDKLLYVRITASSQASDVTSNFYRCGLHFRAAQ